MNGHAKPLISIAQKKNVQVSTEIHVERYKKNVLQIGCKVCGKQQTTYIPCICVYALAHMVAKLETKICVMPENQFLCCIYL